MIYEPCAEDILIGGLMATGAQAEKVLATYFCTVAAEDLARAADRVRLAIQKAPPSPAKEELAVLYRRFGEVQLKLNELKRKL